MAPKKSKAQKKLLGQYLKNKKTLTLIEHNINEQNNEIRKLNFRLKRKHSEIKQLHESLSDGPAVAKKSAIEISKSNISRRAKMPTSSNINIRNRVRRRSETLKVCSALHGGTR